MRIPRYLTYLDGYSLLPSRTNSKSYVIGLFGFLNMSISVLFELSDISLAYNQAVRILRSILRWGFFQLF